jgi:hypothetical protein
MVFFLIFYIVVGGDLKHIPYQEQGHIVGYPTKVACERAQTRKLIKSIKEGLVPMVQFAAICVEDTGDLEDEYYDEWNIHRYDYSA